MDTQQQQSQECVIFNKMTRNTTTQLNTIKSSNAIKILLLCGKKSPSCSAFKTPVQIPPLVRIDWEKTTTRLDNTWRATWCGLIITLLQTHSTTYGAIHVHTLYIRNLYDIKSGERYVTSMYMMFMPNIDCKQHKNSTRIYLSFWNLDYYYNHGKEIKFTSSFIHMAYN